MFFTEKILETFYIKKIFHQFDPHVGDTCYQIRAYQMLIFIESFTRSKRLSILTKLSEIDKLICRIEQDISYYKKVDKIRQQNKNIRTILKQFILDN